MDIMKAATFAVIHFSIAFTITYILTKDALAGGLVALIEPSCNTVAYLIHEKLWKKYRKSPG
jgi:uncharacterized membrane protein